jgi:hypothetical protein
MKTKYIISALLAMAGLAVGAQANVTGALPDLIVGFSQSGAADDYELNLGSITSYTGLGANTELNLSGDLSALDLQSAFGTSWNTSSAVTWGAVATVGSPSVTTGVANKTVWATQAGGIALGLAPAGTVPPPAYPNEINTLANDRYSGISGLTTGGANTGINGATASTNTANANTAALISTGPGSTNGWTALVDTSTGKVYQGFSGPIDSNTNVDITSGQYSEIDLFQYSGLSASGSGSYIGSLELSSTGGLFFTNYIPTVAIPEPSVYAAILGAACMGFVAIRRRKQQVIA